MHEMSPVLSQRSHAIVFLRVDEYVSPFRGALLNEGVRAVPVTLIDVVRDFAGGLVWAVIPPPTKAARHRLPAVRRATLVWTPALPGTLEALAACRAAVRRLAFLALCGLRAHCRLPRFTGFIPVR